MKIKYKDIKYQKDTEEGLTYTAKRFYENKYFGLFVNGYRYPNLTKDQNRYLFKSLWEKGTICVFIIEDTKSTPTLQQLLSNSSSSTLILENKNPQGVLCLVPYATSKYSINDTPSLVNYINKRGATFIPRGLKKVNEDCVLGWAHSSHAPVCSLVRFYIDKIVDVENTINVNLFVHKLPRLIVCSPEDKARVEDLMERIESGEKKLFLDANDVQAIKNVLDSGNASYIIDRLYQYKQNLENELLTFMGFNNIPVEKAERLITAEADSNNEVISDSADCFINCLKDFAKEVKEVLNFDMGELDINNDPEDLELPQEDKEKEEDEND